MGTVLLFYVPVGTFSPIWGDVLMEALLFENDLTLGRFDSSPLCHVGVTEYPSHNSDCVLCITPSVYQIAL